MPMKPKATKPKVTKTPATEVPQPDAAMIERIHRAMQTTWATIGGDVLALDEGNRSIPRAEVIEVTLDAGYMEMYARDKEAIAALRKLPYAQQIKIAEGTFNCSRYGM